MEVNSVANQLEVLPDPDKDEYYYLIKKRIYQAAKDGHSLALQTILNRVDDVGIKTVLVNQVRRNIIAYKHQHELSVRKKIFQENTNFAEKERKRFEDREKVYFNVKCRWNVLKEKFGWFWLCFDEKFSLVVISSLWCISCVCLHHIKITTTQQRSTHKKKKVGEKTLRRARTVMRSILSCADCI